MCWEDLLKEVTCKKEQKRSLNQTNKKPIQRKIYKVYALGDRFGRIYFTKREAECMVHLLRGKTIARVALELKLSPRTVEFYLKNMKTKLGCRTKFELIDLVINSDFMKNVDF